LLEKSDIGKQYLEFADSSVMEIIEANFKDDRIKAMLGFVSCLRGHGPVLEQKGNGIIFPLLLWAAQNGCLVQGGTQRLGEAMVRSLYANGGIVLKNRPVEKILVEGGRAVGVKSGAMTFRARKFIASNLVPQQTLLQFVGSEYLDASLVQKIKNYKPKVEALFGAHTAHKEKTRFYVEKTEPRVGEAMVVNIGYESLQDVRDDFRDIRNGVPPGTPKVALVAPTWFDDTQGPPGGQSTLLWQFAPCQLADGGIDGWKDIQDEYAWRTVKSWARYGDNIDSDENLIAVFSHSSYDTVQSIPSMVLGDRHHGEYSVDQMGYNRPMPELSQYKTPIEGLFLCGASTHPGGSITGAPGHNAAVAICKDLGIDAWWNPPDLRVVLQELAEHGRTTRYARMGL
jgi:phytoene dehydrogenase-like protein